MSPRLRDYLETPTRGPEVDRVWEGVAARLHGPRHGFALGGAARAGRRVALLAASLAALLVAVFVGGVFLGGRWLAPRAASVASAPRALQMKDGSEIELSPAARLEVVSVSPSHVELLLASGEALFRVSRVPSRVFVVRAGGHLVRVFGTSFRVAVDDARVSVSVLEGVVGVSRLDGTDLVRLHAGELWAMSHSEAAPVSPGDAPPVASAAAAPEPPAGSAAEVPPSIAKPSATLEGNRCTDPVLGGIASAAYSLAA